MTIAINSYADVQTQLAAFVASAGVAPALAPHGIFYAELTYDQFTTDDVPGVSGGFKILEIGNSAKSNIIMALSGTPGTTFDPNGTGIGQMPQPSPPYDAATPTQSDIITALAAWIDKGCPK